MHDLISQLGGLIWVGLVVIGVVSSIVRSAKRQRAAAQGGAQPAQPSPVRIAGVPQGLHAQFSAAASPVAAPAPRPQPQRPAAFVAPPAPPVMPPLDPPDPPAPFVPQTATVAPPHSPIAAARPLRAGRLFASRSAIVQSIVASEILGKPRALRDEY